MLGAVGWEVSMPQERRVHDSYGQELVAEEKRRREEAIANGKDEYTPATPDEYKAHAEMDWEGTKVFGEWASEVYDSLTNVRLTRDVVGRGSSCESVGWSIEE